MRTCAPFASTTRKCSPTSRPRWAGRLARPLGRPTRSPLHPRAGLPTPSPCANRGLSTRRQTGKIAEVLKELKLATGARALSSNYVAADSTATTDGTESRLARVQRLRYAYGAATAATARRTPSIATAPLAPCAPSHTPTPSLPRFLHRQASSPSTSAKTWLRSWRRRSGKRARLVPLSLTSTATKCLCRASARPPLSPKHPYPSTPSPLNPSSAPSPPHPRIRLDIGVAVASPAKRTQGKYANQGPVEDYSKGSAALAAAAAAKEKAKVCRALLRRVHLSPFPQPARHHSPRTSNPDPPLEIDACSEKPGKGEQKGHEVHHLLLWRACSEKAKGQVAAIGEGARPSHSTRPSPPSRLHYTKSPGPRHHHTPTTLAHHTTPAPQPPPPFFQMLYKWLFFNRHLHKEEKQTLGKKNIKGYGEKRKCETCARRHSNAARARRGDEGLGRVMTKEQNHPDTSREKKKALFATTYKSCRAKGPTPLLDGCGGAPSEATAHTLNTRLRA